MIAVAIIGVLASIAIPAFNQYMLQARFAEVPSNLSELYKHSVAYWERPISEKGLGATGAGHCLVPSCCTDWIPPLPPGQEKRFPDWSQRNPLSAVGFEPTGGLYACYGMFTSASAGGFDGACNATESMFAPTNLVYMFQAFTDLDGDGRLGGAYLEVGIRGEQLYRAPALTPIINMFPPGGCPFCSPSEVD